jgi:hypothetical protein
MRPTSAELITRISDALDTTVLPAIKDDKWAASVVRSAMTLLSHLATRVELEAPVLIADNADADEALRAVAASLAKHPALHGRVKNGLENGIAIPLYDAVALDARNREYQTVIEAILRELHNSPDAADRNTRGVLLDYLRRRVGRERDIYFPAFTGPPF